LIDVGPVERCRDRGISTPTIIEDRRRGIDLLMIASADGVTRIGTELRLIAVARIRLKGAVRPSRDGHWWVRKDAYSLV
jgi:hypothetical protein